MGLVLIFIVLESYLYFLMPILKFKHTKKYQDEYNMIFSSDTIIWRTPSIETEMKWDFYSELWESNDFYFLVQSPHIYGIIPKRAFATNTDKYTFEEIALSNLKSVKR